MVYVSQSDPQYPPLVADAVRDLKKKIICDFTKYIKKVRTGSKPNYELIMQEISLLDMLPCIAYEKEFYFILQYYLDKKWEVIQY